MSIFQNDPPANCAGQRNILECGWCDRRNPFGGEFVPDINIDSDDPRCLSFSDRHPRPDYQEAAL